MNLNIIEQYLDQNLVISFLRQRLGPIEFLTVTPFVPMGINYIRGELQKLQEQDPVKKQELGRQIIQVAAVIFDVSVVFPESEVQLLEEAAEDNIG